MATPAKRDHNKAVLADLIASKNEQPYMVVELGDDGEDLVIQNPALWSDAVQLWLMQSYPKKPAKGKAPDPELEHLKARTFAILNLFGREDASRFEAAGGNFELLDEMHKNAKGCTLGEALAS